MRDYWNKIADALEEARKLLCPYPPQFPTCDCKYGISHSTNLYASERTGCPELRSLITIYRRAANNDTSPAEGPFIKPSMGKTIENSDEV